MRGWVWTCNHNIKFGQYSHLTSKQDMQILLKHDDSLVRVAPTEHEKKGYEQVHTYFSLKKLVAMENKEIIVIGKQASWKFLVYVKHFNYILIQLSKIIFP